MTSIPSIIASSIHPSIHPRCVCDLSGFNNDHFTASGGNGTDGFCLFLYFSIFCCCCYNLRITAKSQAIVNKFQANAPDCDCAPSVCLTLWQTRDIYTNFVNQPLKYNTEHKDCLLLLCYRLICMHSMIFVIIIMMFSNNNSTLSCYW